MIISLPSGDISVKKTKAKPGRYYWCDNKKKWVHESEIKTKESKDQLHINTGEWARGWHEHIDTKPIYIENKSHLKRECEKRGLIAKALSKRKSQGKGIEHRR